MVVMQEKMTTLICTKDSKKSLYFSYVLECKDKPTLACNTTPVKRSIPIDKFYFSLGIITFLPDDNTRMMVTFQFSAFTFLHGQIDLNMHLSFTK